MKKIKLVMSDLDETLLKSHKAVSEFDQEMLNRLIDEGVEVIPTTGRHHGGIPQYFFEHDGIRFLVSSNGAQIYDKKTHKVLFNSNIDQDLAFDLVSEVEHGVSHVSLVVADGMVVDQRFHDNLNDSQRQFFMRLDEKPQIVQSMTEFIKNTTTPIIKINLAFDDLEYRNEVYDKFKKLDTINAEASSLRNVELTNASTSKGAALNFMMEHLNLDRDEILAIGDNDNDITMLSNAGLGIAMGNASDHVKSHSDTVTLDVEDDGFGHAIKKVFNY